MVNCLPDELSLLRYLFLQTSAANSEYPLLPQI